MQKRCHEDKSQHFVLSSLLHVRNQKIKARSNRHTVSRAVNRFWGDMRHCAAVASICPVWEAVEQSEVEVVRVRIVRVA